MPKVSIIVPVYNTETYLEECLDSIIAQTLGDIEIICVNDGSTDKSEDILQKYQLKDKRIKVITHKNKGYGYSVNRGIEAASADYVGIIESDDFIKPEMYEDLYKLITENNCDIVKSDWFDYWGDTGKTVKNGKIAKFKAGKILNAQEDKKLLKIKPSVWSCLYRKGFLNEAGIKFLETPGASYQDCSFALKVMVAANRVVVTDKAYVYYRQDNPGASVLCRDKVYCLCEEYAEVERYLKENPPLDKYFMSKVLALRFRGYLWNLERIDEKYRLEFVKYFADEFRNFYENGKLDEFFFKKNKKKNLLLLINNPEKFLVNFKKSLMRAKFNELRRKFISVRINSARVSISLFDRQIIKME